MISAMRVGIRSCLGIVVAGLVGSSAMANGFRNPPESATGLGMAGAKLTHIEDASAVTINPANLLRLEEPSVMGSLTLVRSRVEYTGADGRKARTRDSLTLLPNLHAAWPLEYGDWVAGVGLTTPFGQSTEWRKDSPFRYTSPYLAELMVVNLSPTVATRVHDRVTIGGGLNLMYSELSLRSIVPWSSQLGLGFNPAMDGRARLDGDGFGLGATIGVSFDITDVQRLAVTYRSPFNIDYEGDMRLSNVPPLAAGAVASRSDFETTMKFPTVVAVGYGIQVSDTVRLGVDVEWIEFSRFSTLDIDAGVNNAAGFGQEIPQEWKDTWTVGGGGEWDVSQPWTVRGSYMFMESPIPSRTMGPTLPDADRHLITVGVTYALTSGAVDLAYAYSIFEDRTVRDNQQPAYNGDYDLSSHLFQVSYRRNF